MTGRMSSGTCYTKLNFDFSYVRSLLLRRDTYIVIYIYIYIYIYNFDKTHFLYASGSLVSTLECLYDCILDNMFLFCRNILNHIFLSCLIKLNPLKFSQEGINIEITQFIIFLLLSKFSQL